VIELVEPSADQRALFDGLAQFYAYDFSEMTDNPINPDGRYGSHQWVAETWAAQDRFIRLIMYGDEAAGFAIVQLVSEGHFDMEQFFVMRKFRRSGVGRVAARMLFLEFSGHWTAEQITNNVSAQLFWREVINEFTAGAYEDTMGEDPMQSFVT